MGRGWRGLLQVMVVLWEGVQLKKQDAEKSMVMA